jgi:hypothetical protein
MIQQEANTSVPVVTPDDAAKILRPQLQIPRPADERRLVSTATFIGASYEPGQGLFWRDLLWGEYAFDACASLGLHVDYDVKITAVDLNKGHDFHDPRVASIPADLLAGFLLARPLRHPGNACCRESGPLLRVSKNDAGKNDWKKSLKLCNPKVAIFFSEPGKFEDIGTDDLKTSGYVEAKAVYMLAPLLDYAGRFLVKIAPLVREDIAEILPRHHFLQAPSASRYSTSHPAPGE